MDKIVVITSPKVVLEFNFFREMLTRMCKADIIDLFANPMGIDASELKLINKKEIISKIYIEFEE